MPLLATLSGLGDMFKKSNDPAIAGVNETVIVESERVLGLLLDSRQVP